MGAIIPALTHRIPQNCRVKRAWAREILGWVTSWEVLVLHPFLVVFCFIFNGSDLSCFIFYGRLTRPVQDEEKASKSGLPSMFTRNYEKEPINASRP